MSEREHWVVSMKITGAFLIAGLALGATQDPAADPKVDFSRDILPIFRASCLKCHGPEKPKGQFRLDTKPLAMKGGVTGRDIVPGSSKESLVVKLLHATDDEERMPQKSPALPMEKIELIRRWIDQGALWPDAAGDAKVQTHWAYVSPVRREPPAVKNAAWVRSPIDAFVLARLEKEGIAPSPEADRPTLLKRLSYDLLGLPPSPDETAAFVNDAASDAIEKQVDRLLASPHFGERWGRHWLDKARYADSDGYEKDNSRPDAWRYRDWVIDALNADLPFDRFTVEQLAGDLLPGSTPMQLLATAFHRQTLTNTEGGVDKEQFRVEAVFDRTETTGAVWLGLTVGCARCHNHKFDRITQQEFYQLFAFFNNGDETAADVPLPVDQVAKYARDKEEHDRRLTALHEELEAMKAAIAGGVPLWEAEVRAKLAAEDADAYRFHPLEIMTIKPTAEVTFKKLDDGSLLAGGAEPATDTYVVTAKAALKEITGFRLEVLADKALPSSGPGRAPHGNFVLSEFRVEAGGRKVALAEAEADFSQDQWPVKAAIDGKTSTGWAISPQMAKDHHAVFKTKQPVHLGLNEALTITLDQQHGDRHTIGRFRLLAMTGTRPHFDLPDDVKKAIAIEPANRSEAEKRLLIDRYAAEAPATSKIVQQIQIEKGLGPKPPVINVRVIRQRGGDPRKSAILRRGDFLQPLSEVQPGTLASLPPLKPRGAVPDRLDLARWIVDPGNPVTPRVAVNHLWANLFGQGLVRTPNDFGVRGERPTDPELLDWLATEFIRRSWSVKSMVRLIASSSTYRQSARHRPELADRDPQNLLLHRQNRWRVEGEIVRDLTLAACGLLSPRIGGPSVFPPMPADIAALSYANSFKWKNSEGEDRYRRGMYTYFKRTAPYPGLTTFDCPDSNTTCVQRRQSNTPLQALTALNNEVFSEAARAMAKRVMGKDLDWAFRLCAARAPTAAERGRLEKLLERSREWYRGHPEEAKTLSGDAETAAWTATARVLNLDEFLTRE
jgi:mono/diheme cytochrome c family protein